MSLLDPAAPAHSAPITRPSWLHAIPDMIADLKQRIVGEARIDTYGPGPVQDPARKDYLRDIGMEVNF